MPKKLPGWQQFEADLQELLGLSGTVCSGNQFNDIGDAVDNSPPSGNHFRMLVDGKYSEKFSYPIPVKAVRQWLETAAEKGKRGIVAFRLWPRGQHSPTDLVVLGLDDFAELVEKARLYDNWNLGPIIDSVAGRTEPPY